MADTINSSLALLSGDRRSSSFPELRSPFRRDWVVLDALTTQGQQDGSLTYRCPAAWASAQLRHVGQWEPN